MPTYDLVVVHPLVLLSVVDHYNRVAKDTKKRVVGILLGETYKGRVDITNCFAGMHCLSVNLFCSHTCSLRSTTDCSVLYSTF